MYGSCGAAACRWPFLFNFSRDCCCLGRELDVDVDVDVAAAKLVALRIACRGCAPCLSSSLLCQMCFYMLMCSRAMAGSILRWRPAALAPLACDGCCVLVVEQPRPIPPLYCLLP